jgi:hypothetical protein
MGLIVRKAGKRAVSLYVTDQPGQRISGRRVEGHRLPPGRCMPPSSIICWSKLDGLVVTVGTKRCSCVNTP